MSTETAKDKKKNTKGTTKDSAIRYVYFLQALYERPRTCAELLEVITEKELKEVDIRTVQRDMKALHGSFGVYEEEEEKGLWHLDKTDFHKLFELEDAVALALIVAEKQLADITPSHILTPLSTLFKRARAQLEAKETAAAHWVKRVKVTSASHQLQPPVISKNLYERIVQCALEQCAVKIDYHRLPGAPAETYTVTALSIFYRGSVPYLICRDHENQHVKQFPFSRISDIRESIVTNPQVEDFDFDEYAKSGSLAFRYGDPFTLELEIFNSVRREIEDAKLGENQEITPIEGKKGLYQVSVEVPYTLNLIQWLLARAAYLKVKGPHDFREKFYEELRRALHNGESEHVDVPAERNFVSAITSSA